MDSGPVAWEIGACADGAIAAAVIEGPNHVSMSFGEIHGVVMLVVILDV